MQKPKHPEVYDPKELISETAKSHEAIDPEPVITPHTLHAACCRSFLLQTEFKTIQSTIQFNIQVALKDFYFWLW